MYGNSNIFEYSPHSGLFGGEGGGGGGGYGIPVNQTDVVRLGWVSSGWVGVGQFVQLGRTLTYSIFWMKVSKLSPGIT